MGNYNWESDLVEGNQAEQQFAALLQLRKPGKQPEFCTDNSWDIKYGELTFECKADAKSELTGNVIIEIEFNGKPSGILVSKSKYWAVRALNRWNVAFTEVVRHHMEDYPIVKCGDGRKGKGHLMPYPDYRDLCDVVFTLDGRTLPPV